MRDKFLRVKSLVQDHQLAIGMGVGVAVGLVALKVLGSKSAALWCLHVSPDQLQALLTNPENVVVFPVSSRETIQLVSSMSKHALSH